MKIPFFLTTLFVLCICACTPDTKSGPELWCDQQLRPELAELESVSVSSNWFKVYRVGEGVFAIMEPYNFQEVISFLILGDNKALLFDTGMGLEPISPVIQQLTDLPVMVVNSHSHYDHIGGNYEFDNVIARNTLAMKERVKRGAPHEQVRGEVTPAALCLDKLTNLDTAAYAIKPFDVSYYFTEIADFSLPLGGRDIKVLFVPGHSPDAVALYDEDNGYLWTGDTFYEAPIWLFHNGTNLTAYRNSIELLAGLSGNLNKVFPAHNLPVASPARLNELVTAFDQVVSGEKKAAADSENPEVSTFEFEHFSFVIRSKLLDGYQNP